MPRMTKSEVLYHMAHARGHLQAIQTGEGVPQELTVEMEKITNSLHYMQEDLSHLYPEVEGLNELF